MMKASCAGSLELGLVAVFNILSGPMLLLGML